MGPKGFLRGVWIWSVRPDGPTGHTRGHCIQPICCFHLATLIQQSLGAHLGVPTCLHARIFSLGSYLTRSSHHDYIDYKFFSKVLVKQNRIIFFEIYFLFQVYAYFFLSTNMYTNYFLSKFQIFTLPK
jgi:hypothetical protein